MIKINPKHVVINVSRDNLGNLSSVLQPTLGSSDGVSSRRIS